MGRRREAMGRQGLPVLYIFMCVSPLAATATAHERTRCRKKMHDVMLRKHAVLRASVHPAFPLNRSMAYTPMCARTCAPARYPESASGAWPPRPRSA